MLAVEAFLAVPVNLVEGLPDRHAALLQLDLHQWQPVDKDRHVIAIGVRTGLLELLDNLQLISGHVLLVEEVNVLDAPVIKDEIVDVVVVDFAGFVDDVVAWLVQVGLDKTLPLII